MDDAQVFVRDLEAERRRRFLAELAARVAVDHGRGDARVVARRAVAVALAIEEEIRERLRG